MREVLTVLFAGRVLGQALVAFAGVTWLPAMDAWYSGLLPYPVLLPAQILILLVQVKLNLDARRGRGLFARPRPRLGRTVKVVSYFYAAAMLARYVLTGTHAIPVAFHLVLAAYLFLLGRRASEAKPAQMTGRHSGYGTIGCWPSLPGSSAGRAGDC